MCHSYGNAALLHSTSTTTDCKRCPSMHQHSPYCLKNSAEVSNRHTAYRLERAHRMPSRLVMVSRLQGYLPRTSAAWSACSHNCIALSDPGMMMMMHAVTRACRGHAMHGGRVATHMAAWRRTQELACSIGEIADPAPPRCSWEASCGGRKKTPSAARRDVCAHSASTRVGNPTSPIIRFKRAAAFDRPTLHTTLHSITGTPRLASQPTPRLTTTTTMATLQAIRAGTALAPAASRRPCAPVASLGRALPARASQVRAASSIRERCRDGSSSPAPSPLVTRAPSTHVVCVCVRVRPLCRPPPLPRRSWGNGSLVWRRRSSSRSCAPASPLWPCAPRPPKEQSLTRLRRESGPRSRRACLPRGQALATGRNGRSAPHCTCPPQWHLHYLVQTPVWPCIVRGINAICPINPCCFARHALRLLEPLSQHTPLIVWPCCCLPPSAIHAAPSPRSWAPRMRPRWSRSASFSSGARRGRGGEVACQIGGLVGSCP